MTQGISKTLLLDAPVIVDGRQLMQHTSTGPGAIAETRAIPVQWAG